MRAQRIASRLMVELCGAKLVPGTIDVAAEPPPPTELAPARRAGRGAPRHRDRPGRPGRLPGAARLRRRAATGEDLEVTVPPDRHYDVTREVDLIEEVGRIHGLDENLPSTLPGSAGQVGGLDREQRLRRRAEDTMRDLGFDEVVGWSFTDPGEPGRLRIAADDPRGAGVVDRQPALRGPVGDADDGARLAARRRPRQPRPRRRAASPSSSRAASTCRPATPSGQPIGRRPAGGRFRRRAAGAVPRAAPDRAPRRRPAGREVLAGRGRAGRLLRPQGRARGPRRPARRRALLRGRRGAVPASRPRGAAVAGRRRRRRLDRRAAPAGLPRVGHRGGGRLRSRPGGAGRAPPPPARRSTRT